MSEQKLKSGPKPTVNNLSGTVHGSVIQAGKIEGGVHYHHVPDVRRSRVSTTSYSPLAGVLTVLFRWLGWGGVGRMVAGQYAGTCLAGFAAVVTGKVFESGGNWPLAAQGALVAGALMGLVIANTTRRRFLVDLENRTRLFVLVGAASFPFALAYGEGSSSAHGGADLFVTAPLLGGAIGIGVTVWVRYSGGR